MQTVHYEAKLGRFFSLSFFIWIKKSFVFKDITKILYGGGDCNNTINSKRLYRIFIFNEPDGIENATHNSFAKLSCFFLGLKKHKT
jgi:hypothetical protein